MILGKVTERGFRHLGLFRFLGLLLTWGVTGPQDYTLKKSEIDILGSLNQTSNMINSWG